MSVSGLFSDSNPQQKANDHWCVLESALSQGQSLNWKEIAFLVKADPSIVAELEHTLLGILERKITGIQCASYASEAENFSHIPINVRLFIIKILLGDEVSRKGRPPKWRWPERFKQAAAELIYARHLERAQKRADGIAKKKFGHEKPSEVAYRTAAKEMGVSVGSLRDLMYPNRH